MDEARVAVVTGAASGIGAATARRLRAAGVVLAGIDLNEAPDTELSIRTDVSDSTETEAAIAQIEKELGAVDLLVTAAGYYEWRDIGSIPVQEWRRMQDVHVHGTANVCRSVYRRQLSRGRGAIVTVGSELALCGDPQAAHYAAAKGAIHGFTKSLAVEAAQHGIRVNCVAPGPTDTPLLKSEMRSEEYINSLVLRRLVSPDEVAATIVYALLGDHNFVGQVLSPNAGAVV